MSLAGHLWTLRGYLSRERLRLEPPPSRPWSTVVDDPVVGRVALSGRLVPEGDDVVVVVHGLGGSVDSGYVQLATAAVTTAGMASLALNVRGADRSGEDFSHAALTADLAAAISSPELARYRRVFVLGYSLGGHVALRHAVEEHDDRLCAVAAICPPLDLSACCDFIDRPAAFLYRRYLLRQLTEIYTEVARRRPVEVPVAEVRRIRTQREFDDRVIAPRHGFDGVDDYYRRASVGPLLAGLELPALLVLAEDDPMIPAQSLEPFVASPAADLTARWVRGGHVGFPRDLDLGQAASLGLEPQVVAWLAGVSPHVP